MAAMYFLVADRAVLVHRQIQIVECRWNYSSHADRVISGQVGVAFKTYEAYFVPRQHARIRGAMRLMARGAAFESHRFMLECEGAALIAVAVETSGFVGAEALLHRGAYGTVRIVAIDAAHRVLRQLVMVGLLELRPYVQVATGALRIDRGVAVWYQTQGPIRVNFVATHARDLILGMTVLQSAHLRRRVEMAIHANLVGRSHGQLRRLADIRR
jgi:hypothetical protein